MQLPEILSATLGLSKPWHLAEAVISADRKRLDITIRYEDGLESEHCSDDQEMQWSHWFHQNVLNYETYLHIRAPHDILQQGAENSLPCCRRDSKFIPIPKDAN